MPTFKAFSDRARAQLADPLAAAKALARPASPLRAILGPGTGPLPVPNGAAQDATDSDMSSVGQEEVQERQRFLDHASAAFLGATQTGITNEAGEELYTDGTFRPAPVVPARAPAAPQHFYMGSDADEGGAMTPNGTRKRAQEADSQERAMSPRLHRTQPGDVDDDSCPNLSDSSLSVPGTPRTPVKTIVKRLDTSVRQNSLKRNSPRASRSVSPVAAVEKSEPSGSAGKPLDGDDLEHSHKKVITPRSGGDDLEHFGTHPEASSSSGRRVPLLQGGLKKTKSSSRATSPRTTRDEVTAKRKLVPQKPSSAN